MKTIAFLLSSLGLALLIAPCTHAAHPDTSPLRGSTSYTATYYDRVGALFDEGYLPAKDALLGWWSGRCYLKSAPNNPIGMMLTANDVSPIDSPNHGPLFPTSPSKFVMNIWAWISGDTNAPDRFDYSLEHSDKQLFAEAIAQYAVANLSLADVEYNAWHSTDPSVKFELYLRRNQNVFVVKANRDGAAYGACYFFKRIE